MLIIVQFGRCVWKSRGWRLVFLSLCMLGSGQRTSFAQEAEPVQPKAVELEEIVVSAERITPVEGAAAAVVTAEEIREYQAKDVAEILKTAVSGVTGKRVGGMHLDPIIRGLREDRLSVMTNGTKIWGGGPFRMDPPTSLLEVDELEAIEVIKGPYSVTRGPSGIGGTINLVTKEPELSPEWYARGSFGALYASNYNGWATQASVTAGGPTLAFRLSGGYRDYQDYASGDGENVASGFQSQSVSGTVVWQPHTNHRFRLSISRESDRDARFATLPLGLEEDDAYLGSVRYSLLNPFPSVESLEFTAYYNYVHHRMKNEHKPSRSMVRIVFPLDARTFGGRVQASILPGFGGRLALGGDIYRLEREGTNHLSFLRGPMAGKSTFFDNWPDTRIMDGGIFGEYAYQLASRWRLIVGSRVDFVDADARPNARVRMGYRRFYGPGAEAVAESETNVSANGRLVYSPLSSLDLFVGIGRAVRTADATERYFALGPGPGGFFVGNPRLEPEESLEFDLGLKGIWGKLAFEGSFFYNRIDEYILQYVLERTDVNGDGRTDIVRGFRNIDSAALIGMDLGLSYAVRQDLSLLGSFAYVRGENEEDDTALPEIPPFEGRLGFRYEHIDWGVWLSPMVRLVQSQHRIDTAFLEDMTPGFVSVDIGAGWRFLGSYELTLSVANLLDKNYHEHVTRENPFTGREVFEPGRVVTVGLRATF